MNRESRREYWEKQIEGWRRSGKSISMWTKERGLCRASFCNWRNRLGEGGRFVELKVEQSSGGLAVEVGGEIRIRIEHGFDAGLLRECVQALRGL